MKPTNTSNHILVENIKSPLLREYAKRWMAKQNKQDQPEVALDRAQSKAEPEGTDKNNRQETHQ
tara:strand:+ start:308 stop:499 length:192 start_codon:yes stop_codon:yes gene_type:complete